MFSSANLGIFGSPLPGLLYIVNDNIFWRAEGREAPGVLRRVGTLSGWLKSVAQHVPSNNLSSRIPDHTSWIEEFKFCICYLIPYLKFLNTGHESDMTCSKEIEEAVLDVARRAEILRGSFGNTECQSISIDLLQRIFCVPCVIVSQRIIPLEPSGIPVCTTSDGISISYQYSKSKAKSLSSIIAQVNQAFGKVSNQESMASDSHRETAALMQEADRIIDHFGPVNVGPFQVIYYDRYHQVHYNRGNFVLVRGPLCMRNTNQGVSFFVGLAISGRTRTEWLLRRPRRCNKPEQLWTAAGVPILDGMCMGNPAQYRRLFTQQFTDAEAIVQWLHAGVILTTGFSQFHKQQRSMKYKEMQQKNFRLEMLEMKRLENERRKRILPLNRLHGAGTMLPDGRHLRRGVR